MKKSIGLVIICAFVFLGASLSFGQGHLLITEFAVTPTEGEFIEIYNPTANSIDLTNYYVTDATFSGSETSPPVYYYEIVEGGGGGGTFGDFNSRFPAGAEIGPGEYQTIALNGNGDFLAAYGKEPTYELYEDNTATDVPDMLEAVAGSINGQGGLSGGEVIVLYWWDGATDLVSDIDYVVWDDKREAVDKTDIKMDGPDADTDSSTYADDTPISAQTVVNTGNVPGDRPPSHSFGNSAQRKLDVEDVETWTGGNGITGHDETSENTSFLGGIWTIDEPATPGWRSIGDSLTIADLQFLRAEDIGAGANDDAPREGDTLTVTGVVMHQMNELFLGARWGGFLSDLHGGPWSGFFVIQNDSTVSGTNLIAAQPGDKIRLTGVLQEFPGNATQSISQLVLSTSPAVPIEFLDFGLAPPDTMLLTPGDLGATGSGEDPTLTERLESTLVRFENLEVLSNAPGQSGQIMTAGDATGTIAIDDYFLNLRTLVTSNGGQWPGFPAGTKINITGFVRDVQSGGLGRTTINPRSLADIEIASIPPEISSVVRDPATPASTDNVTVTADIVDGDGTVASANLMYSVDEGEYQTVAMVEGSSFSGEIPAQADNAFVKFFLEATDNASNTTIFPGDTSAATFFYFVRDAGISISDVQQTPFADGRSGYDGLEVTLTGIVTSPKENFDGGFINRSFYIQDAEAVWSGIQVFDPADSVGLGDNVTVTGTVGENFALTRLTNITSFTRNSSGDPPAPVVVTTGEIGTGGENAEAYESVLVEVRNVTVTDPFPDGVGNTRFGEFSVDDGSGEVRIDDESIHSYTQTDTMWTGGETIAFIRGIQHYHNSNYKIQPRNDGDLGDITTGVDDIDNIPLVFDLRQNYPNPFNPVTTIQYSLPQKELVSITIFNLMGQKVTTLVDKVQAAGKHAIRWQGTNSQNLKVASGIYFYKMKSGSFTKIQKMLLLK